MSYFVTIIILIVAGIVAKFIVPTLLNIAGIPGALIGKDAIHGTFKYKLGLSIAIIGQTYTYLAYGALVLSWSLMQCQNNALNKWIILPIALLLTVWLPIANIYRHAKLESAELGEITIPFQALDICRQIALAFFLLFFFYPPSMKFLWNWIPYVQLI